MILQKGEKVHIITRRNFETDVRRHFLGEVIDCVRDLIRVSGYSYVFDNSRNEYLKRNDLRVKIFGLGDSNIITNVLPQDALLENVVYTVSKDKRLVVTDGKTFSLDINEFGATR